MLWIAHTPCNSGAGGSTDTQRGRAGFATSAAPGRSAGIAIAAQATGGVTGCDQVRCASVLVRLAIANQEAREKDAAN